MCLFCKIINKEVPAEIVYEDKEFVVFKDIRPKAPLHLLVLPKKHIPSVNHLTEQDKELVGQLFLVAQKVAREQGVAAGYKLVFNVGKEGGQMIDHLHLHLLSGWKSKEEREVPGMP
jgi:histidine triad (HIT) family protein